MEHHVKSPALEIDLTAPPSSDVAALAAVVSDMGRWTCELEERLSSLEALLDDDELGPKMTRLYPLRRSADRES